MADCGVCAGLADPVLISLGQSPSCLGHSLGSGGEACPEQACSHDLASGLWGACHASPCHAPSLPVSHPPVCVTPTSCLPCGCVWIRLSLSWRPLRSCARRCTELCALSPTACFLPPVSCPHRFNSRPLSDNLAPGALGGMPGVPHGGGGVGTGASGALMGSPADPGRSGAGAGPEASLIAVKKG